MRKKCKGRRALMLGLVVCLSAGSAYGQEFNRGVGIQAPRANYEFAAPLGAGHDLSADSGGAADAGIKASATAELVIVDTDIGDDIDDAFAIGLALQSPEVNILGITTAWGNTGLRAR